MLIFSYTSKGILGSVPCLTIYKVILRYYLSPYLKAHLHVRIFNTMLGIQNLIQQIII